MADLSGPPWLCQACLTNRIAPDLWDKGQRRCTACEEAAFIKGVWPGYRVERRPYGLVYTKEDK